MSPLGELGRILFLKLYLGAPGLCADQRIIMVIVFRAIGDI